MKKNLIITVALISFLCAINSNANGIQITDTTVYNNFKKVEVCGGLAEIHLNDKNQMLTDKNKVLYPMLSEASIEALKNNDERVCYRYKVPENVLKQINYYGGGLFFKH